MCPLTQLVQSFRMGVHQCVDYAQSYLLMGRHLDTPPQIWQGTQGHGEISEKVLAKT